MSTLVIGIGHPYRRDDSVGPRVAEDIAALGLADLTVLVHHGEGSDLMERWSGYSRVVVIDATASGAAPGTVRHWDAVAAPLPAGLFPKGSHVFGVAEGIELARRLGRLPALIDVVGIEGADFSAGEGLSPLVDAATATARATVLRLAGQGG